MKFWAVGIFICMFSGRKVEKHCGYSPVSSISPNTQTFHHGLTIVVAGET